ncbi:cytochrome oxidase maturation protein, cbb3-type [Marinobacter zhejiangensis]|uniref:Cytochrome oxidase maturation protein, cbb3-type n=2 Tax=Marinobacter zhejiangensis TaxID=488535 RepID=A0A1I4RFK4_9GAMM|nr:cytochrome oxidase maturation protein, cbb3-type [Marinobacter zhejiangensis]
MILVPVTLILVGGGIYLFSWAVKSGQYDDLEGPAHRILYDDDKDMIPSDVRPSSGGRPDPEAAVSDEKEKHATNSGNPTD